MTAEVAGRRWLPVAAALVTVVLWASAFVGIRSAGHHLSGGPLAFARLVIGTAALVTVCLVRREKLRPARGDVPALLVCGVLWFGLYNVALNIAERHVDAGTAAMVVNVGPILIAVIAGVWLREGFPRLLVVGAAVSFAGALLIGYATATRHGPRQSPLGVGLCLVAALAYAIGVVSQKPLLARLSALQVTTSACFVGMVVCLPFGPQLVRELGRAPGTTVGWAVYLGLFPTAVAFTTWAYALARTTAGRLGATTYLVPPLAVLLGFALLGESPAPLAVIGGAVCLAGVAVARRSR